MTYLKMNKSPKTIKREIGVLKHFNKFLNGNPLLSDISLQLIEKYKEKRLGLGMSPATVSIELRILKTIFNKGKQWEIVEKNR